MCVHVNKNCLNQVNTEVVGAPIEPLWGSTHVESGSCLGSGLDLILPFWRSSSIKLIKENSELNHQESFLSSLLYLQPQNAQVLSHLSLLRHSPTEVEWDECEWWWPKSGSRKLWGRIVSIKRPKSEWNIRVFLLGLWVFWSQDQKLIKIYLVLGLDQRLKCPNEELQQWIMKKHK